MYSKNATPPHWINWVRIGQRTNTSCRPRPISTSSKVKPTAAPNTCFWLAAKPKRAPALRATTFTGPGVMEVARAKAAMEMIKLIAVPFCYAKRRWHHGKGLNGRGIEENHPEPLDGFIPLI